jgi:hypothetical protein
MSPCRPHTRGSSRSCGPCHSPTLSRRYVQENYGSSTILMRLQFSVSEVTKLKSRLQEINDSMVDGKFVDEEGKELRGSQNVAELLGRCLQWSDIVLERYAVRWYSAASPLTLPQKRSHPRELPRQIRHPHQHPQRPRKALHHASMVAARDGSLRLPTTTRQD